MEKEFWKKVAKITDFKEKGYNTLKSRDYVLDIVFSKHSTQC
jgi:hypothetical protein